MWMCEGGGGSDGEVNVENKGNNLIRKQIKVTFYSDDDGGYSISDFYTSIIAE